MDDMNFEKAYEVIQLGSVRAQFFYEYKFALLLAKKLQDGEVSNLMMNEGTSNFDLPENVDCIYRAMVAQLIKETRKELNL